MIEFFICIYLLLFFIFIYPYSKLGMQRSKSFSQKQYSSLVVNSKISFFREKFNQSQQKFNQKYTRDISSPKKLASLKPTSSSQLRQTPSKSRPSSGKNNDSTTKKQILNIMIESSELNPERKFTLVDMKASILLSELDGKAKEMTGYAEENAALLQKKSNLEDKIARLKRAIAQEKKRLSEVQSNCGLLTNNINVTQERWEEKNLQSKELAQRIQQTTHDIKQLKKSVSQNTAESNYNQKHINLLENQINDLSLTVANTNISLMKENEKRLETKEALTLELKVMDNDAILYRQLVSQQSNLQSQIDKAFKENKMEGSREPGRSRLSVQSNKK